MNNAAQATAAKTVRAEQSPCFFAGPYTAESFTTAPAFAVFEGEAADPGPVPFALFDLDGYGTFGDLDEASAATGLDVQASEPEVCDDENDGRAFDDTHAALAHLRAGGALCKVPDSEGSPHYRLLVVAQVEDVSAAEHERRMAFLGFAHWGCK